MKQYDYSIDFVKGIATLLVIIFHAIIGDTDNMCGVLNIEQGVPLFLLATSYLYFKAQENKPITFYKSHQFLKMFNRVFVPFLIFQAIIFFIHYSRYGGINFLNVSLSGGIGMGAYYPWLFLQFWLLIPCFAYLIKQKKLKMWQAIVISILFEVAYNILDSAGVFGKYPDNIWRLFVGRYVFIIYLGSLIAENRFNYIKFIPIILVGIAFTLLERYDVWSVPYLNYSPNIGIWEGFHWYLYFYSATIFILLRKLFEVSSCPIKNSLKWIGKHSWEIFLSQMLYFYLRWVTRKDFDFGNPLISTILWVLVAIVSSIIIAVLFIKLKELINKLI